MRTRDDVLLLGTGKCAQEGCISSWARIHKACNLSFCGAHVETHKCGQFQRPVSFSGKGTPGAVRRSDVVSGGPGERARQLSSSSEKNKTVDKSVPPNGKNGKRK